MACVGSCTRTSLIQGASDQTPRVTPRLVATGMGVAEDPMPLGPLAGLVLAAGSLAV